jgi:hypothetical protein
MAARNMKEEGERDEEGNRVRKDRNDEKMAG